jgi:uncharacterized Tic20 family protein
MDSLNELLLSVVASVGALIGVLIIWEILKEKRK